MLQIRRMPVGQIGTNCYLLEDSQRMRCAIIDPGDQSDDIAREMEEQITAIAEKGADEV